MAVTCDGFFTTSLSEAIDNSHVGLNLRSKERAGFGNSNTILPRTSKHTAINTSSSLSDCTYLEDCWNTIEEDIDYEVEGHMSLRKMLSSELAVTKATLLAHTKEKAAVSIGAIIANVFLDVSIPIWIIIIVVMATLKFGLDLANTSLNGTPRDSIFRSSVLTAIIAITGITMGIIAHNAILYVDKDVAAAYNTLRNIRYIGGVLSFKWLLVFWGVGLYIVETAIAMVAFRKKLPTKVSINFDRE